MMFLRRIFPTYFRQMKIGIFRQELARHGSAVQDLIDEVLPVQRSRLQAIRQVGPWHEEHSTLTRLQREQAQLVITRMKQHRQLREEMSELERLLPPRTGWNRLRYINPLVPMWILLGLTLVQSVYVWIRVGVFG